MTSPSPVPGPPRVSGGRRSRRALRRRLALLAGILLAGGAAAGVIVARRPDADARARALRDEMAARVAAGEGAAVVPILETFVSGRPQDGLARALLAAAQLDAGMTARAAENVALLLTQHPDLRGVRLLSARCRAADGDPHGALRELDACPESEQATAGLLRAQVLSSMGRLARASQAYAGADGLLDGEPALLADAALVEIRLAASGAPDSARHRVRAQSLGRRLGDAADAARRRAGANDVTPILHRALAAEATGSASAGEILAIFDQAAAVAGGEGAATVVLARAAFAARAGLRDELRAMVAAGIRERRPGTPDVAASLASCAGPPGPGDIEALRSAVEAWPDDVRLRTLTIRVLVGAGRGREADDLAGSPGPGADLDLRVAAAETAEALGDRVRADLALSDLEAQVPDRREVRLLRARVWTARLAQRTAVMGMAERSAVRSWLASALGPDPDDPVVLDVAARFALADGRDADAWDFAKRLVKVTPADREARVLAFTAAFRGAPDPDVQDLMEWATAAEDTTAAEFVSIAESALGAGRTFAALAAARRGAARHPAEPALRRLLARALLATSDADGAATAIREAPALADDPEARRILAEASARQGRIEEALAILPRQPTRDDEFARADILLRAGRTEDAERLLRGLLSADPSDARASAALSAVLVSSGRAADAVALLQLAASAEDAPTPLLAALAAAHASRGVADAGVRESLTRLRTRLEARTDGAADALRIASWIALGAEDHAVARDALSQYVRMRPGDAQAWHDLALLHSRLGDLPATIGAARTASRLAPGRRETRTLLARALFVDASAKFGVRDLGNARASIEEVLALDPAWLPGQRGFATILASQGMPELCEAQCRRILDLNPADVTARIILAHVLREKGDRDGALALADACVKDRPDSAEVRIQRGVLRLTSGVPLLAREDFESARASGAAGPVLEYGLAGCAVFARDAEAAMAHARRAVELAPEDPRCLAVLGEAFQLRGDVDAAVAAWTAATDRVPGWTAPLVSSARLLVSKGRFQEAARICAGIRNPEGDAAMVAGEAHLGAGNAMEARRAFEAATVQDPAAWVRAGVAAEAAGDLEGALAAYRTGAAARPADRAVRVLLANAQWKSGRQSEALDLLRDLVAAKGDDLVALNNLAALLVDGIVAPPNPVTSAADAARCRQARDLAVRARAVAPAQPDVADTLGWTQWLCGDEPAARTLLEEAIRTGDRADARYHLGVIDAAAGRTKEARANLDAAVRAVPEASWAAHARSLLEPK